MKFLNSAVRVIVMAFVFIAGAITLAGPDATVNQSDVAINSAAPVQQDNDAAVKSAISVTKEHDVTVSKNTEAPVNLQAISR